jgi:hypothetical protein
MLPSTSKLAIVAAAAVLGGMPALQAAGQDAAKLIAGLLVTLTDYQNSGSPSDTRQVSFQLPESALNLYLKSIMAPRPMMDGLEVQLLAGNRCSVQAKVDFDAVAKAAPDLFTKDERAVWKGWKPVTAEIRFTVSAGRITFKASPAAGAGALPDRLLPDVIRVIARNQPEKIDTTGPIPLPFGLRQLSTSDKLLAGRT